MHLGAGVGPAVGVSVLRGQGVGLPTVKVPFWPGVRMNLPISKKYRDEVRQKHIQYMAWRCE